MDKADVLRVARDHGLWDEGIGKTYMTPDDLVEFAARIEALALELAVKACQARESVIPDDGSTAADFWRRGFKHGRDGCIEAIRALTPQQQEK